MNTRKNIIVDEKIWDFLAVKAESEKTSVSQLISQAVQSTYKIETVYQKRKNASETLMKLKESYPKVSYTTNFKELAHEGHKR
jgi:hypothetical protein